MSVSRQVWFGVLVCVGAATAFLWVRSVTLPMQRAPDGHYVLVDPDSYIRWRLVERAVAGEGVRIRWINDDNAPFGRMNEWTSPMTICGVAAAKVFGKNGSLWLGPVIGLAGLAALGWLGWKVGGWSLALCWLVAWPALGPVWQVTQFGNVDHHGLHLLLFIVMVGGCLLNRTTAAGVLVGLASAVGLWSAGSEMLPAWVVVAGLAVWEMSRAERRAHEDKFWRAWWVSGLAGTTAAWLYEFWPHVFHPGIEIISVWHVGLWLVCGGLLEYVARSGRRSRQMTACVLAMVVIVLWAGAESGFDWARLHVMQNELFKRQLQFTVEFAPWMRAGWRAGLTQGWWQFGLLVPLLLVPAASIRTLDGRSRWLLGVAGIYGLLTLVEARWDYFLAAAVVMSVGVGLRCRWPRRPWWCVALVVLATIPPWMAVARLRNEARAVAANPLRGPNGTTFVLEAASDCLSRTGRRPVVLAVWDQGAVLAGMGKVRVIGSGYWSNLDGLRDTHEMFSTTSAQQFWELVRKREVEYFLVPPPALLADAISDSWWLMNGTRPTIAQVKATVIWQVASRGDFPVVSCESMTRIAPQGFILQLEKIAKPGSRPHQVR